MKRKKIYPREPELYLLDEEYQERSEDIETFDSDCGVNLADLQMCADKYLASHPDLIEPKIYVYGGSDRYDEYPPYVAIQVRYKVKLSEKLQLLYKLRNDKAKIAYQKKLGRWRERCQEVDNYNNNLQQTTKF